MILSHHDHPYETHTCRHNMDTEKDERDFKQSTTFPTSSALLTTLYQSIMLVH